MLILRNCFNDIVMVLFQHVSAFILVLKGDNFGYLTLLDTARKNKLGQHIQTRIILLWKAFFW